MSRSYKHTPYCGMKKDQFYKKYFNRKIRRNKNYDEDDENLHHNQYKKKTDTWSICDYDEIGTTNFQKYYERQLHLHEVYKQMFPSYNDLPPTREQCWKEYKLTYFRK